MGAHIPVGVTEIALCGVDHHSNRILEREHPSCSTCHLPPVTLTTPVCRALGSGSRESGPHPPPIRLLRIRRQRICSWLPGPARHLSPPHRLCSGREREPGLQRGRPSCGRQLSQPQRPLCVRLGSGQPRPQPCTPYRTTTPRCEV